MRHVSAMMLGGAAVFVSLAGLAACGSSNSQPVQPTGAQTAYPPGTYPPPGQTAYPPGTTPPGYPQPPPPGYPPQPGQPMPGATAQLATPGPLALPCTNDSACMTHKCNTQYGKCAFPCATDNDCIQGAYCLQGIAACVPKSPGQ